LKQNLAKLVTNLLEEPFQKWGLDFFDLFKSNITSTKDGFKHYHPLKQSSFRTIVDKKIIKLKFKTTSIWPFNPKAMDSKTQTSQINTAKPVNDQGNEKTKHMMKLNIIKTGKKNVQLHKFYI